MRYLVYLLILVINISVSAQSDYRPGYIIKNGGDKEEGWINFIGNVSNGKHCYFKKDSAGTATEYFPNDLIAYRFTDSKYYVSKKITTEDGEKTLFLECLISGKATIYYSEQGSEVHYYIEKNGKLVEIDNKEVLVEDENGNTGYKETNRYKGILKYYFSDCPSVFRKVDAAELDKKSLIRLSKDYHEYVCKDEKCIIYEKSFSKNEVKLGVDFSYGFGKLNFYYNGYLFFSARSTYQYLLNMFVQMNLDEDKRYFLQLSIGYNAVNFQQSNLDVSNFFSYSHAKITYKYSLIRTTLSLKHKLNFGKVSPFASLGIPLGLFLVDKGTLSGNQSTNSNIQSFNRSGFNNELEKDRLLFGGVGEIGVEFPFLSTQKRVFFSIFYEYLATHYEIRNNRLGLKSGIYF
ncbi:MAG TPA: hypothetical protein VIH57_17130 [Bacteroidales bacterium]